MEEEKKQDELEINSYLGGLETQGQNGLKHNDYRRYRAYCSKKLKRIRTLMKFSYGRGKYVKQNIEKECPTDQQILDVFLFQSEHDWAYGMDLKQQVTAEGENANQRMRHHIIKKFKRASQWGKKLRDLCEKRAQQQTALESLAYSCYLDGLYLQQREEWVNALQINIQSRETYLELLGVALKQKIQILEQSIRYVYQQNGGSMLDNINKIVEKQKQGNLSESELVVEKNSKALEQKENLTEVSYHGEILPIQNPQTIAAIQKMEEIFERINEMKAQRENDKLMSETSDEEKVKIQDILLAFYIEIFSLYDDSLQLTIKDKEDSQTSEAEKSIYGLIQSYFNLKKLEQLAERNELLVRLAVDQFEQEKGFLNLELLSTQKAFKQKLTRPAEIVKLCDNYLQAIQQIMEIERHNPNLELFRFYDGLDIAFKGHRCLFVACVYFSNNKFIEALSLLKYCDNFYSTAIQRLTELGKDDFIEQMRGTLGFLNTQSKVRMFSKQAQEEENIVEKVSEMNIEGQTHTATLEDLILQSQLDSKNKPDISLTKLSTMPIIDLIPQNDLVGCKPIFFDLAYSALKYPNIQQKIKEDQKSTGGGFFSKFNIFKQ